MTFKEASELPLLAKGTIPEGYVSPCSRREIAFRFDPVTGQVLKFWSFGGDPVDSPNGYVQAYLEKAECIQHAEQILKDFGAAHDYSLTFEAIPPYEPFWDDSDFGMNPRGDA